MWEWRVFSNHPIILEFVEQFDFSEERVDRYFLYYNPKYGFKIRNYLDKRSFEVKYLVKTDMDFEFWEKTNIPWKKCMDGVGKELIECLRSLGIHLPNNWENDFIDIKFIDVHKERDQIPFLLIDKKYFQTTFESTKIKIEQNLIYTICIESTNLEELKLIKEEYFNTVGEWQIMNYPQYLINKF